jgi:sporulation protein YlmC with PRC-barrel domain
MEATQETGNLIASDKVQGTNVYNTAGDNLGAIHDVMIDKPSGKVAFAILSFGGFLGIGNQYHPLPWSVLKYDINLAVTLSISTSGNWKELQPTTSAPNQRGATAPTKARYTNITVSDPTGPSDVGARHFSCCA